MRIGYDGQNGRSYVGIGKLLLGLCDVLATQVAGLRRRA